MKLVQTLNEFISENFSSKREFAEALGIFPQQITKWQNQDYIVIDGVMYKSMRVLAEFENTEDL